MTNYSVWDSKATALLRDAEKEDEVEEAQNNQALGLTGAPQGPPTVKADSELQELGNHSNQRKEFIAWSKQREVSICHKSQQQPVELSDPELQSKALRIEGSHDVTYIVPAGSQIIKLILEQCKDVCIQVAGSILTSTIEACRCEDVDLQLSVPVGTIQVDECVSSLRVHFEEYDHIGRIYHMNSPGFCLAWGNTDAESHNVGKAGSTQLCTRMNGFGGVESALVTVPVQRGEKEFPIEVQSDAQRCDQNQADENYIKASMRRQAGNEMYRASDFLQAAMEYTATLELDPTMAAVWANRSQCWLKLGEHGKALEDAAKCTELDPANAKGWFRQGISLHALQRYPEAIAPLLQAEKLEPNNKQIPEAVKMAQLMARRQAGGA